MILSVTTMPWGKKKSVSEFESVLQSIKDIGFEGVGIEHSLIPKELNHDPGMLAEIMKRVGLKNGGSYSRTKLSDIAWAKASKDSAILGQRQREDFPQRDQASPRFFKQDSEGRDHERDPQRTQELV